MVSGFSLKSRYVIRQHTSSTNLKNYKLTNGANDCEFIRPEGALWRRKKSVFSIIMVTAINIISELKLQLYKWKDLCLENILLQVLVDICSLKLSYM